jgi:hypothetical protein
MEAPNSGSDSYWPYDFLASCKGHIGRRLSGTLIAVSLLDREARRSVKHAWPNAASASPLREVRGAAPREGILTVVGGGSGDAWNGPPAVFEDHPLRAIRAMADASLSEL